MSDSTDHFSTPRKIAFVMSALLVALGVLVLVGWMRDITALKSVFPNFTAMAANTAAGMLLSGVTLALLAMQKASKTRQRVTATLALLIATLGAATLAEHLLGWDLHIEQMLVNEASNREQMIIRMSPSTAVCFLFTGLALFSASFSAAKRWRRPLVGALGAAIVVFGATTLLAYAMGTVFDAHLWNYTGTAVHTALGFVLIGCGLSAVIRGEGSPKWSLDAVTTAGVLIGVFCLIASAMISNDLTYRLRRDDSLVSQTHEVIKVVEAINGDMTDLDGGQRGFIITADEHFLDRRGPGKKQVESDLAAFRSLTADNATQTRRVDELAVLITARNAWGDKTITARRESGFPEAQRLIASNVGIVLSERIRNALAEMRAEENTLLEARQKRSNATTTKTFLLLPLGVILSFTMLFLALFSLNASASERAQAEEILRQQASLLDLAPVLVRDMQGRVVFWSSGLEKLYNYSKQEAEGSISHFLLHTEFPVPLENIEHSLEVDGSWEGELQHRGRGGNRVIVNSLWVLYRDTQGQPVRILEVNTDITARKRAETLQLRSQKLESLGTLSGGIAHDFNNILLAISGNTKLAIADLPPGHPVQESLSEIAKAGARATDLVRRILTFSRPGEIKRQVLELQPVVEEALKLVRATLPATIEFRTAFSPGLPTVLADSTQVHQIIVNLATNAAHAIGAKSNGLIEVRLDAADLTPDDSSASLNLPDGRYVRLFISDNGCGMDRATLERIYDPFFTTKGPGEGTGLGLSVVHGIMKNHDGGIAVYSEPGHGTAFRLFFPAAGSAPAAVPESHGDVQRQRTENILYVDDEEALVVLVTRTLRRLGYRVTGQTDPTKALELFRCNPAAFDAIVTDLAMPQLSGFDLATQILALRPDVPIIMISGYVRSEDQERALRMGLRDLILKPDTIEQLGRTLDRIFQQEASPSKTINS